MTPLSSKHRILVVEDEPELCAFLKEELTNEGYDVICAGDGLEGLKMARTEKPDLILLDVILPRLNGLQVARLLKYDDNYKHIPIILWSWKESEQDIEWGQESGAEEYIPKPFSYPKLLVSIKRLLREDV